MTMNSSPALKTYLVFMCTAQSIQERVKKDIAAYGINYTEFGVLELLYSKGRQPIQQIAQKILLSSGSMTYVIDKLEQKQFIAREDCPSDRRVIYAVLTKQGSHFMDDIFPQHLQIIEQIFGILTEEEQLEAMSLFKKMGYQAKT